MRFKNRIPDRVEVENGFRFLYYGKDEGGIGKVVDYSNHVNHDIISANPCNINVVEGSCPTGYEKAGGEYLFRITLVTPQGLPPELWLFVG